VLESLPSLRQCHQWSRLGFASTLHLYPVLELLLVGVPSQWKPELRLGLQEALVNAAKHGNKLDPLKQVWVYFTVIKGQYWWIIVDQGIGFRPAGLRLYQDTACPEECGRGLYIVYVIFDQVQWNHRGTELRLCKDVNHSTRLPILT